MTDTPKANVVTLDPADERDASAAIQAAIEQPDQLVTVSATELDRWVQNGEWPDG